MAAITGLIIAGIVGAALSAAAAIGGSAMNYDAQQKTNQLNKEAVESTNATNLEIAEKNNALQMDLAKHGTQYKMNDLKAAGLNPILAVQGMTSPQATLSTPHMQAPQAQAPMIDFNGIANAITAMNNMYMTEAMVSNRKDIADDRNSVLKDLYKRKGIYLDNASDSARLVSSARQVNRWTKKDEKQWDAMMKELGYIKHK